MSESNQHSSPDAEIVLATIRKGYHKGGHHPNCSTRTDEGCDCYARATADARAALARLVEQLEEARADLYKCKHEREILSRNLSAFTGNA